jgi:hypothetical protein
MVLDGAAMPVASPSEVVLRRLPAVLTLRY